MRASSGNLWGHVWSCLVACMTSVALRIQGLRVLLPVLLYLKEYSQPSGSWLNGHPDPRCSHQHVLYGQGKAKVPRTSLWSIQKLLLLASTPSSVAWVGYEGGVGMAFLKGVFVPWLCLISRSLISSAACCICPGVGLLHHLVSRM